MAKKTAVKDYYGRIIGWVEEDLKGNKIIRNFYGQIVGKYDKTANLTRDFYNRIVARGDVAVGLLYKDKK